MNDEIVNYNGRTYEITAITFWVHVSNKGGLKSKEDYCYEILYSGPGGFWLEWRIARAIRKIDKKLTNGHTRKERARTRLRKKMGGIRERLA